VPEHLEKMQRRFALRLGATALATALLTAAPAMSTDCTCHKPEKGDKTRRGANIMVVVPMEKSFRELRGTVQMPDGRVLENALVEIFDNADYLLQSGPLKQPHQTRLAKCVTGSDGKFCFRHLPSGTYELRSSIDTGWNVTHVHVTVDKRSGASEEFTVVMSLGI
jgi:protocatechuate 3,4-dioxygenase beta subunit